MSVPRKPGVIWWWAAACMIAAHFSLAYIDGTVDWLDLHRYVAGQERLPFQYRVLTVWLLRGLAALPGPGWVAAHGPAHLNDALVICWLVLTALSVVAILWLGRRLARAIWQREPAASLAGLSLAVPLYIQYEALANTSRLSYPYDLPSLALFLGVLLLITEGRMVAAAVLFVPATLARETSLLLIPALLAWSMLAPDGRRRGPGDAELRRGLVLAAIMAVVWLGLRLVLRHWYAGNPVNTGVGHVAAMELQWRANLAYVASPLHLPSLLSSLCWLWLPVALCWRRIGDARLRAALAANTVLALGLMAVVGSLAEPRVFAELSLFYWLAANRIAASHFAVPRQAQSGVSPAAELL